MLQRIVPTVATVLGICAFISITMYSVYLNAVPQYTIVCTGCSPGENCGRTAIEDYSLWGMVQKCNWLTTIAYMAMYTLLCYAIGVIVERWLTYYYAERQSREFASRMADAIYSNRINEAKNIAAGFPKSPPAAVINASLQRGQTAGVCATNGIAPSIEARQQAMVVKTEELKQALWSLSAAGWTIPLIGFLILVVTVVNTLQGVKYAEGSYSPYLADSLANALWATIFSLLVGIPVIWFHKYFAAKLETLLTQMDRLSLAIIGQIANPPQPIMAGDFVTSYITKPLDIRVTHRLRD